MTNTLAWIIVGMSCFLFGVYAVSAVLGTSAYVFSWGDFAMVTGGFIVLVGTMVVVVIE